MKVFGLGYDGFHDSNIGIMNKKGEVVFAISEERLSNIKKDGRFPTKSIKLAKPNYNDILCVSTLRDNDFKKEFDKANIKINKDILGERKKTFKNINKFKNKFKKTYFFSHHDCHAASAYYFSGFKKAIVLTWDAGNNSEPWNMTVSLGQGLKLTRIEESLDGSPCLDYTAITAILGFTPVKHEGKITGLSAMGSSSKKDQEKIINILNKYKGSHDSLIGRIGKWRNVGSKNSVPKLEINRILAEKILKELQMSREDIANAIQKITEERVMKKILEIKKKHKFKNICLAGGLFANVIINKKILEAGFEKIFIHPAMGDDGLGLGACAKYLADQGIRIKEIKNTFFGPNFNNEEIKKVLIKKKLNFYTPDNLEKEIAKQLSNGKIIARFAGNMEYGPRALGNRSILCQATDKNITDILNKKLKRSEFMPFAPISLEKDMEGLYKNTTKSLLASKFMTIALDCKDKIIKDSPAVVHIDKTARPQLVGKENPNFKKILEEYKKITKISSLINTSFNMHESPIVCSPEEAITAFRQSNLDFLVIGKFLAYK